MWNFYLALVIFINKYINDLNLFFILINVNSYSSNIKSKNQEKPFYKLTLKHKQRQYNSRLTTPPKIDPRNIQTWKSQRCIIHNQADLPSENVLNPHRNQDFLGSRRSINIITSSQPMFEINHRRNSKNFETLKEANGIVRMIRK